jgi:hypothetical protein
LFCADKQIDKTKLIIAFLNYVKGPKKQKVSVQHNIYFFAESTAFNAAWPISS